MRMKEIPERNRPRERLERLGSKSLSDAELLAIILQSGTMDENAVDLANRILSKNRDGVRMSLSELINIKGIGKAKAAKIMALFELIRRSDCSGNESSPVNSAIDAVSYFKEMRFLDKENFAVLLLDAKNKSIRKETISIGILDASLTHPREVFRTAIRNNACSIIVAHNHPSGDPEPSEEDGKITKQLIEAGRIIGIRILDHLIIGKDSYYSFADSGDIIFA